MEIGELQKNSIQKLKVEVKEYIESLPKWDKTKYFVKWADDGSSPLCYCETGDPVPITEDLSEGLKEELKKGWPKKGEIGAMRITKGGKFEKIERE